MTTEKAEGIRPYGPGKFNTMLDAYVWEVGINGVEEEAGSIDEHGAWYGIMRGGRSIFKDHDPFLEPLTEAEQEMLTGCAGVIMREDSQGFVYIDYVDTDAHLENQWADIEAFFAEEEAEAEAEAEADQEPEPDEDAITTTDHVAFYQYGKLAFDISEVDERTHVAYTLQVAGHAIEPRYFATIDQAIKAALDVMQFWPNVFFVSDHGNAHLIEYWKEAK